MSARIAVFASGGGSNLQALLDHFGSGPGRGSGEVVLAVGDRPEAGALDRARAAGVDTQVIPVMGRPTEAVAADTIDALEAAGTTLVALAGYVRLVPAPVVRRFASRIVNVHPSLLPAFGGRGMYGSRVHEAVLAAGCRITGPTVHFVNERYDEGRILTQWPVPVLDDDSPESLARRVLRAEHVLYPAAVEWLARVVAGARGNDAVAPPLPGTVRGFEGMTAEAPSA
ncbi:MAG TPA: phosphoribosylglycinamide formyltransferase, partial [Longimicrobiales bacterium]|nr:phosphoribosylglycinamide formyltransferase [Longimicrobiales bacterium]